MPIQEAMLRRVVSNAEVSPDDVRRALAIACLAVAADGKLADEESAALGVLSAALGGSGPAWLDGIVQSNLNLPTREDRIDQLRATADSLTTEAARHLAYKLSVAVALADLTSTDEEFEFDLDVQDALQLSPDAAFRLVGEVHEALRPEP